MIHSTAILLTAVLIFIGVGALIVAGCLQAGLRKKRAAYPSLEPNWRRAQRYIILLFVAGGMLVLCPPAAQTLSLFSEIESSTVSALQGSLDEAKRIGFLDSVERGSLTEARQYLREGVDPNASFPDDDLNALMMACANNDDAMVGLLLEYGADPDFPSSDGGLTALMYAGGNPQSVRRLIAAGADVNAVDNEGLYTPLAEACASYRSEESARLLIESGADVTYQMSDGLTALSYLVSMEDGYDPQQIETQLVLIHLLLESGASVESDPFASDLSLTARQLISASAAAITDTDKLASYQSTANEILGLLEPAKEG